METEMPLMLLFVSNGTEQGSVMTDTKQMVDLALDDIEQNRMLPKEFEGKDIPIFTIRLNVPHVPSERKPTTTKGYREESIPLQSSKRRYQLLQVSLGSRAQDACQH